MMNFKTFEKDALLKYVKTFGFESIEDDAFMRTVMILEVMVYNLLNNVNDLHPLNKEKSITKKDFEEVMTKLKESRVGKSKTPKSVMSGGHAGTVLPSEYFGTDSGRYFDMSVVKPLEQSAFADGVARAAIQYQQGGCPECSEFIGKKQLKFLIDEFKTSKGLQFTVSSGAYDVMLMCLRNNLRLLFQTYRKHSKAKKVTLKMLGVIRTKHFPHMDYTHKK